MVRIVLREMLGQGLVEGSDLTVRFAAEPARRVTLVISCRRRPLAPPNPGHGLETAAAAMTRLSGGLDSREDDDSWTVTLSLERANGER